MEESYTTIEAVKISEVLLCSGSVIKLTGRLRGIRRHAQSTFADIQDHYGVFQLLIPEPTADELHSGDWITVAGSLEKTRKGAVCLRVCSLEVVATCQRLDNNPADVGELDYRKHSICRAAHIAYAPMLGERLAYRSQLIRRVRTLLWEKGFMEVDTPTLEASPGTTKARAFTTVSRAYKKEYYLRRTSELWLKQALSAGYPRVFEIGRQFRNEGVSAQHAPEFMQCELYAVGWTYIQMLDALQEILKEIARNESNSSHLDSQFLAACLQPLKILDFSTECHSPTNNADAVQAWKLYSKSNASNSSAIVAILHGLAATSPLTSRLPNMPWLVEDFRFYWNGIELGHGTTELTDPSEQLRALEAHAADQGNRDGIEIDTDFMKTLQFGLPKCAGLAFAIDRVIMAACGSKSLHDQHWFPQF